MGFEEEEGQKEKHDMKFACFGPTEHICENHTWPNGSFPCRTSSLLGFLVSRYVN